MRREARTRPDPDAVLAAAEESMFGMTDTGFCIRCGEEAHGVENDAQKDECLICGERTVYGAVALLEMGYAD